MKTIDYFTSANQPHWLEQINNCDWGAGKYLYQLLKDNQLKQLTGEKTRLLMLTDGDDLVAFCTLAEKDDIQPTPLTPWIGFVYTFPTYRGNHYAGMLLKHAEELAKKDGFDSVYISTNHVGLYEKYGYKFLDLMNDINGEASRVYARSLGIEIRQIDFQHGSDINIPNEPFPLFGCMIPHYDGEKWSYEVVEFEPKMITEMCFPDENYDFCSMTDSVFLGAYDGGECIGLAILQPGFFKYMYLYDLKVNKACRRKGVGKKLIERSKQIAKELGYNGLYTQGQDNNLGACLFYIKNGFYIGGFDSNVYRHTKQEGKSDIIFYCEAE